MQTKHPYKASKVSLGLITCHTLQDPECFHVILSSFVVNTQTENNSRGQLSLQDMKKVLRMEYEALQAVRLCTFVHICAICALEMMRE